MAQRALLFKAAIISVVLALVILVSFTLTRLSDVAAKNSEEIKRIQAVEVVVQGIIDQGKLGCVDRAKFRHVLRVVITADPDTTPTVIDLLNKDFPEIVCS